MRNLISKYQGLDTHSLSLPNLRSIQSGRTAKDGLEYNVTTRHISINSLCIDPNNTIPSSYKMEQVVSEIHASGNTYRRCMIREELTSFCSKDKELCGNVSPWSDVESKATVASMIKGACKSILPAGNGSLTSTVRHRGQGNSASTNNEETKDCQNGDKEFSSRTVQPGIQHQHTSSLRRQTINKISQEDQTYPWVFLFIIVPVIVVIGLLPFYVFYPVTSECSVDISIANLQELFYREVYGQEIAIQNTLSAFKEFLSMQEASVNTPLVLNFYGGTGVGKTHMATVMQKHFVSNSNVLHYAVPGNNTKRSLNHIYSMVVPQLSKCGLNLVIIDGVDFQLPHALIAGVDFVNSLNMINVKENYSIVILFISGFTLCDTKNTCNQDKGSFSFSYNQHMFELGSQIEKSFKETPLMTRAVPFSLLAKDDIISCIKDMLHKEKLPASPQLVQKVLESVSSDSTLFPFGCKGISSKVHLAASDFKTLT